MNRRLLLALPVAGVSTAAAALAARRALDPGPLPPPPGLVREIGGERIHYLDEGSGPAIVLVHGFGGSTFSWRNVVPLLAPVFRVVALDLPGFGYSDRDPHLPLSHAGQAARVVRLLDTLGIARATLVGHSMGGSVVTRVAEMYPDRVDRLILVASMDASEALPWTRNGGRARRQRAMLVGSRFAALVPPLISSMTRRALRDIVYDPEIVGAELVRGYVRPLLQPGTANCLAAMVRDTAEQQPADLSRVQAPTLVISGDHDTAIPPATGERIAAGIAGARHVILDRCGHLVPDERPDAVVEEILAFVHEAVPA